jgi:hypothetical protein
MLQRDAGERALQHLVVRGGVEHSLHVAHEPQHRILQGRRALAQLAQALAEPVALAQRLIVMLLHPALKLRVLAEAARLVLCDVGGMRLERVGVLETRDEDLDTGSLQDGFAVRRAFRPSPLTDAALKRG